MKILYDFKKELDAISPTFCVAKWKQVTMHLESGLTHSCHHPQPHIVPLDELECNVSALHNTNYKKLMRKEMLAGNIIPECEYCNKIERYSSGEINDNFSDRVYKSKNVWAKKYIPEIVNAPWDDDVFPSYFEVSFSSVCNCSCIYCSSTFSTGWVREIEKYGGYPTSVSCRNSDDSPCPAYMGNINNPYIKAFWKWWPELYKNLDYFRITGGEPLLSSNTFKILDYIIDNPRKDLALAINSNLCINSTIFKNFLEKYKQISENSDRQVTIFTSCEAHGEKAEYIRTGMNYNKFFDNCREYLLQIPNSRLTFTSTYNILSVSSFEDFLKDVLKLKQEFSNRLTIDIPILMSPLYLRPNIISKEFIKYIEDAITFMYGHIDIKYWPPLAGVGFFDFEISRLNRIFNVISKNTQCENIISSRKDFVLFVDEHDKRYKTNFLKVFPEYEDFYYKCKELL